MTLNSFKFLVVAVFSFLIFCTPVVLMAQQEGHENEVKKIESEIETKEKKVLFDANEVIFAHILDAYEFHFFGYEGSDGKEKHVVLPLPVILYSPQKGLSVFMSSAFHHGEKEVEGYKLVHNKKIVPVDATVKIYDFSLTRNVVQMMLALAVLLWIMVSIAGKYKNQGANKAPTGMQNAIEPVITFIRDEVARPNLGAKADKYLPYLLTVFFFILINNIFGMIPAAANVTGNIAFTLILALVSFAIITFSSNKHYWSHIFNPPVPGFVKGILVPVEVLQVFTKPFALMIRLFANMMAGHIIIICLVSLIFIFGGISKGVGWGFSPISIAFAVFIYLIEVLVAFIQAFIFTMLTAVFISQALEGEHHEESHPEQVHH